MYHINDLLATLTLKEGETEKQITLRDAVPIGLIKLEGSGSCKTYISDKDGQFIQVNDNGENRTAAVLKIVGHAPCSVCFYVGAGWWAQADVTYTDSMHKKSGWTGGDGINSFNIATGIDSYNAATDATMFIFGDTFVGEVNTLTDERIKPVEMPNNTFAIMGKNINDLEFVISRDMKGNAQAVLEPSSEVSEKGDWFWLQDGVVINNTLYLSPLVMKMDETKPEGFQFKIGSIAMAAVPIENKKPKFDKARQYCTKLYCSINGYQYVGGIAYMPFTKQAGWENGDGFIYVYGYRSQLEIYRNCELIVGRVKPEHFENQDEWRWFDGNGWETSDISKSAPLLDNVSCEMSVMPIIEGENKGKFLAVFQHNVQSSSTAYAVGDTPCGPFTVANKVWYCDENPRIDETVYTYNAKAHCHLSTPDSILASYNVNTPSMDVNYRFATIYRPRFIRLHDTTI